MYAGADVQLYESLTSAADGMQWSASSPGQSTPGVLGTEKTASQTWSGHCTEENVTVLQEGIELKFPGRPAYGPVHSSRLPRLPFTPLAV